MLSIDREKLRIFHIIRKNFSFFIIDMWDLWCYSGQNASFYDVFKKSSMCSGEHGMIFAKESTFALRKEPVVLC